MNITIEKEDAVYTFIQARFSSKRLPGKVLKSLLDKTLLEWSVERAKNIHSNVNVVVLTGEHTDNLPIINWCKERNILYFLGSEDDVLNRFNKAVIEFGAKTVVRLTADNPLFDFKNALTLLTVHLLEEADYSSSKSEFGSGIPDGIGVEILSSELISRLDSMKLSPSNCEHVNEYVIENVQQFNCLLLGIPQDLSKYNFTIDTKSDFDRIQDWMKNISHKKVNEPDYWKRVVESLEEKR